ncbi:MAG: RNA polymerase sigma factor [Candidatus Zixiibacteriota bacterium]
MGHQSREENAESSVSTNDGRSEERRQIEAAQSGDKAAFGMLVRQHQKRLFRMVYGLVGSFDQAEDIVQDSFIRAWRALGRFQTDRAFYPWLVTIGRNLAYNSISREEKKESFDRLQEKGYNPVSKDLGPLDQLLDDQSGKRFYRALAALPTKYRSVFVLRQFEQMSYSDIASYLKIPPGTVDSRLHRARQLLMDALKDLLE